MSPQLTNLRGDLRVYEVLTLPSTPDLVERHATPDLVERLSDLLGAQLVDYLGSGQEERAVRQSANVVDPSTPSADALNRLRVAYRIAALLRGKESKVIQAWFQCMNPRLDDVAPARLLREGDLEQVGPSIIAAARAFATAG